MLRERDVLGRKIRHTQKHGCRLLKEELKKQDIPVDTGSCRLPKSHSHCFWWLLFFTIIIYQILEGFEGTIFKDFLRNPNETTRRFLRGP